MSDIYNVELIGFGPKDIDKLLKVFQFSSTRERIYVQGDNPDIVIINGDDADAVARGRVLMNEQGLAVVYAGRKRPDDFVTYHMIPPFITSRVLRVLDQVEVDKADVAEAEEEKSVQVEAVDEAAGQYRALVVDDSLALRQSLKIELSALPVNLQIDFAEDGEQALAAVVGAQYDLIFLDIVMPGIDGYEVCRQIRQMDNFKKTPIVMLSGMTSPLDEVKGIMAGCNTYLTKPVVHDEFQKVIHRVFKWLDNSKSE